MPARAFADNARRRNVVVRKILHAAGIHRRLYAVKLYNYNGDGSNGVPEAAVTDRLCARRLSYLYRRCLVPASRHHQGVATSPW